MDDQEPARGDAPSSGRRPAWIAGVVATAVLLLVATVLATGSDLPASEVAAVGDTVLGRLDDGSGRSNTAAPATDLVRRWTAESEYYGSGFPSFALSADVLVVGDRLLATADGAILGPSDDVLFAAWGALSPDGAGAVVAPGAIDLVDVTTGESIGRIESDLVTGDGYVTGWFGDVVVVTIYDNQNGPRTIALDRGTGQLRWRHEFGVWQQLGGRWFLGDERDGRPVLVDGATGALRPVPGRVASDMASPPFVDGGVGYSSTSREVVAWDLDTGEILWTHEVGAVGYGGQVTLDGGLLRIVDGGDIDGNVLWLDPATGAFAAEESIELRDGDPAGFGYQSQVAPLDDLVVVASDDGLRAVAPGGVQWVRDLPDLLGVSGIDGDEDLILALTGTVTVVSDQNGNVRPRYLGDLEAIVLDRDGDERFRVPVRPADYEPSWRFGAKLGEVVTLTQHPASTPTGRLRLIDIEDGGVARLRDVVEPNGVDPSQLVGTVAGGPGTGGPSPLFWRPRDHVLSVPGGAPVPLAGRVGNLDPWPPVVAGGAVAVAVDGGTVIQRMPAPGEGLPVDVTVTRAVGATASGPGALRSTRGSAVRIVPDVWPVGAIDGLLLCAAPPALAGDETRTSPLVAVDPGTGAVAWRSDLLIDVSPTIDRRSQIFDPAAHVGPGARILHRQGGPVVVVEGSTLVALDPDDGTRVWDVSLDGPAPGEGALVAGAVVVPLIEGIAAFDLDTGELRWRYEAGDLVTAFDGAGDAVLAGTASGDVIVLDDDGEVLDVVAGVASRVDDIAVVDGWMVLAHGDGTVVGFGPRPTTVDGSDEVDLPIRSP